MKYEPGREPYLGPGSETFDCMCWDKWVAVVWGAVAGVLVVLLLFKGCELEREEEEGDAKVEVGE